MLFLCIIVIFLGTIVHFLYAFMIFIYMQNSLFLTKFIKVKWNVNFKEMQKMPFFQRILISDIRELGGFH